MQLRNDRRVEFLLDFWEVSVRCSRKLREHDVQMPAAPVLSIDAAEHRARDNVGAQRLAHARGA